MGILTLRKFERKSSDCTFMVPYINLSKHHLFNLRVGGKYHVNPQRRWEGYSWPI